MITAAPIPHVRGPYPGLGERDFRLTCANGFGDGNNSYAYSMAWFDGRLYVGTGRANLQLLKFAMPFVRMDVWPVETPHANYSPEFENDAARGEIWAYTPEIDVWVRVYQAPLIADLDGSLFSRDLGYRAMTVFQGRSDAKPALYIATWSRSKSEGPRLLRSYDGVTFELLPRPDFRTEGREIVFNAIRSLLPFKGRLFTAPAGATKGNVNASGVSFVYATDDPASGDWECVNPEGFGTSPEVVTVYEMAVMDDWLYAGTGGMGGFQLHRSRVEGKGPHTWECVMTGGAGRGKLNQGAVAMYPFQGALYVGTGIQNGGYDWKNGIGPAAAEIVRVHPDHSYEVVVGNARDGRRAISGMGAGFGNFCAGYLWRMGVHDGWLYAGTMDWSVILRFTKLHEKPLRIARALAIAGIDDYLKLQGGFDLWRTCDGENWVPVTRRGFGNAYNFGCRNIVSTPHGLFIGTANPFGPRVAERQSEAWEWAYADNPKGGLEVWLGESHPPSRI